MKYFTGTGLHGRAKRFFFTASGQVPIDRSDSATAGLSGQPSATAGDPPS